MFIRFLNQTPRPHENLFKRLIRSFIYDFLAYFFPDVKVKNCRFIDKELISKYKALKVRIKKKARFMFKNENEIYFPLLLYASGRVET